MATPGDLRRVVFWGKMHELCTKTPGADLMIIFKGARRFEITVDEHYDEWRAALREFIPGRLYPTQHLLRAFDSRQAAIDALKRKWHVLFPDGPALMWRDPPLVTSGRQGRRPRSRGERS